MTFPDPEDLIYVLIIHVLRLTQEKLHPVSMDLMFELLCNRFNVCRDEALC